MQTVYPTVPTPILSLVAVLEFFALPDVVLPHHNTVDFQDRSVRGHDERRLVDTFVLVDATQLEDDSIVVIDDFEDAELVQLYELALAVEFPLLELGILVGIQVYAIEDNLIRFEAELEPDALVPVGLADGFAPLPHFILA